MERDKQDVITGAEQFIWFPGGGVHYSKTCTRVDAP